MSDFEEIIVRGKLGEKKSNVVKFPVSSLPSNYYDTFERDLDVLDQFEEMAETAGALYAAEAKVAEKLAKTKTLTKPKLPAVDILKPKPTYPLVKYQPIDEIIATAQRTVPKMTRLRTALAGFSRLSGVTAGAQLAGMAAVAVATEASRQAFDELGEKVTRTVPARPDTPVQTIAQDEPALALMPEIIKTPDASDYAQLPEYWTDTDAFLDLQRVFDRDMLPDLQENLLQDVFTEPDIAIDVQTPTLPQVETQTLQANQVQTLEQLLNQTQVDTLTDLRTSTRTQTRPKVSTRTRPKTTTITTPRTTTLPRTLTGAALFLPTVVGTATKYCKPCPKKKKQRRKKCYRQLVKQGLYPSRDKVSKWAQIDCVTGKTIKELI